MNTPAIQLSNLTKTYDNGYTAVHQLSLTIQPGDFYALLGPNGAGKSTTISMISHLIKKTRGQISIMGYDLDQQTALAKRQLGLMPQEVNLARFETVSSALRYQAAYYGVPRREAKRNIERLLTLVGLREKQNARIFQLSGGMKRRLMIARALVHDPKVLILDEPTAGVDIEIRQMMWDSLKQLNADGLTIILTTHYLEEAEQLCNKIAIINKGELVENTTMLELLSTLEKEQYIFYLTQPYTSSQIQATFPFKVTAVDDRTLILDIDRDQRLTDIILALQTNGMIVDRFRNKTNRLEQLFLNKITAAVPAE